jgi:ribonucleoside-diphosphate reductase alpha chain
MMPDGHGGKKEYYCKEVHELVISNYSFSIFGNTIGFNDPQKQKAFEYVEQNRKRKANNDSEYTKVTSIKLFGTEAVYDATIEDAHAFAANGIVVHNCEIALRPYQTCNLTEINAGAISTQREFNEAASAAAFIGTLQAGYTDFHYLNPKWRVTCEKESLLGVSMTGIASGTVEKLDMEWAAQCVVDTNAEISKKLGINPAARSTCVKPAGTTSLVLGTSSGIHAWHAPYYIRRMRAGKDEALAQYMMKAAPGLVEQDVTKSNQVVLSFPQKAPEGAVTRDESMMSLLERVKNVSIKWVAKGHISGINRHNVSCTISVKPDEWRQLAIWMWENREYYNGISVLPFFGVEAYPQLPFEDITKEQYESMLPMLANIDISKVFEKDGSSVDLAAELACAGGSCEIKF